MSYKQLVNDTTNAYATCDICGYEWKFPQRYLFGRNYNTSLCSGCTAKPARTVTRNGVMCIPWHGEFTEDDQPLLDGKLYLPGERTCGMRDCVNRKHLVKG